MLCAGDRYATLTHFGDNGFFNVFLAMSFNRSLLGTKGGVRTNRNGQALRADGSVIAGLYAAGLTMANPIGTRALGAGTTLGPNLTWGFICGQSLTRDNR